LSEILLAIQELLADKDPKVVMSQIRASLDETYFVKRSHLLALSQYLSETLQNRRWEEAQKADIIAGRIKNEGLGG
ncbi:MAG: hypothetical protein VKN60_04760, partial [Cyanobacteriota bacterium]|nr:hypothetical protein [Cyanobacteriota bacterium]